MNTTDSMVISSETFAARPASAMASTAKEADPADDLDDDGAYDKTPYESAYIKALANGICIPKRSNSRRAIKLRRKALLTQLRENASNSSTFGQKE